MSTKVDYHRYMASREWALKREEVKERAGGRCERCRDAPVQNVHHLSYEHLGDEPLDELQGVCRPCHAFLSGKSNHDPANEWCFELFCPDCATNDMTISSVETAATPDGRIGLKIYAICDSTGRHRNTLFIGGPTFIAGVWMRR